MDNNGFGNERERADILKAFPGILSRVAEQLGMSPGTVSRTFHGVTKVTNPEIVKALEQTIANLRRQPGKR
jgi:AraC-like DNA-binding protein